MRPTRVFRSETEVTEIEGEVSYRRVVLWVAVGVAIVAGVVAYFRYARLLAPFLG